MRHPSPSTQPAVRALPGTQTSCALLTILTILLAWPNPPVLLAVVVRPCYFALLAWFFWRTAQLAPELPGQPMRLLCLGFLILFAAFTTSALLHATGGASESQGWAYLRYVCERGALFLLGTTLIAYGLMLWIPQVLASHRLLEEHTAAQRGALRDAETTRSRLENHLVDADRRGMLGELAASIAHDLRNPLTIVKGTAESLCRRSRTSREIAEHTAVIRRNIDKADRTIASLIDLARPRQQDPVATSATDLLAEVTALVHVEARRCAVQLVVHNHPGGPHQVRTDRILCTQALLNLVLNAVQATSRGGSVRLLARPLVLAGQRSVVFAIEDRGVGLRPEVRAALCQPFFTTKPNGTGLGLASCRRIAHELGGSLRLYPRHRGGARALLRLPIGLDQDSAPKAESADERRQWAATDC